MYAESDDLTMKWTLLVNIWAGKDLVATVALWGLACLSYNYGIVFCVCLKLIDGASRGFATDISR